MSFYLIGIGGTGAKVVESVVHLCAAGLMPKGRLLAFFVDPDASNGSLGRAQQLLKTYHECRQLQLGSADIFKTEIVLAPRDVWSPCGESPNPKLQEIFLYSDLKQRDKVAADLFDVLYSEGEKGTSLNEGFRGRPSIGAGVLAGTLALGDEDPWKTFKELLKQDTKEGGSAAKIILVGSIFGGTGASGIPTIARLIRKDLEKNGGTQARIAAVLMLPYFSFKSTSGEELKAASENFLLNTKAALSYYYQMGHLNTYDAMYLLGDHNLSQMKRACIGGKAQKNEPHFMELYAALACSDFWSNEKPLGYRMIARNNEESLVWSDLPHVSGYDNVRSKIEQLTRFAFAYRCAYQPMLDDIHKRGKGYRAPWYVSFFKREGVGFGAAEKEFVHVQDYCKSFLLWLANIQTSAKDVNVQLVNHLAFSKSAASEAPESMELLSDREFRTADFGSLTLPIAKGNAHEMTWLWNAMSDAKVMDNHAAGVGKFIHALYRECGESVDNQ